MGECFVWYRPTWVVPGQRLLNGCVCVCTRVSWCQYWAVGRVRSLLSTVALFWLCCMSSCGLSLLATQSIPAHLAAATFANSMTLHLADWLALPAIPLVVSFFRDSSSALTVNTRLKNLQNLDILWNSAVRKMSGH